MFEEFVSKFIAVYTMKINFKKFSQRTRTPTQGTGASAGFDLYSAETRCVPSCSSALIQTDVGYKIPRGYFGKIHPRSNLAIQFTSVGGGVIDSDYRGNVIVIFFNFTSNYYQIRQGEKNRTNSFSENSKPRKI